MPAFYGNTLREVLGKALGTRDQYGRRVKTARSENFANCAEVIP